MSPPPLMWKEQRIVESFEIDAAGRLRPHLLFAHLLNCAWKHSNETTWGYRGLRDRGLMWVLAKIQIVIRRLPLWEEAFAIETWAKGTQRFYALRDFIIVSADGEQLACATSAWMVIHRESRRPQRLDGMSAEFPWVPGKAVMETDLERIDGAADGKERARFRAYVTDIDVNEHVTAMRYLQWIMDSYPPETLEHGTLKGVDISFLAEALIGDEVAVHFRQSDGHDLCSILRANDHKELCRAKVQWGAA